MLGVHCICIKYPVYVIVLHHKPHCCKPVIIMNEEEFKDLMSHKGHKKKSYTLEFKVEAIEYAKGTSKQQASRKYGVDPKRIREWCHQEERLKEEKDSKKAQGMKKRLSGAGRKACSEMLEKMFFEWIVDQRRNRLRVSRKMVQRKALDLWNEEPTGISNDASVQSFEASKGWLDRFLKRYGVTLRKRTTLAQSIPSQVVPKLLDFIVYTRSMIMKHIESEDLSLIGAMDETPIWLDMPGETTLDISGVRSVPVKSTGHHKSRVTVCLAAKANGQKLPPFIVFKGVRRDKEADKVSGVVINMSPNGWMNEDLTLKWIYQVWGQFSFETRLLVWDAFRCHLQESIRSALKKTNTKVAVIPGGCTGNCNRSFIYLEHEQTP